MFQKNIHILSLFLIVSLPLSPFLLRLNFTMFIFSLHLMLEVFFITFVWSFLAPLQLFSFVSALNKFKSSHCAESVGRFSSFAKSASLGIILVRTFEIPRNLSECIPHCYEINPFLSLSFSLKASPRVFTGRIEPFKWLSLWI